MKMNSIRAATMADYQIVIKKHLKFVENEHDRYSEYVVASKIGEGAYGYNLFSNFFYCFNNQNEIFFNFEFFFFLIIFKTIIERYFKQLINLQEIQ